MYYKRINIFTGNFGSGKTEISVNFALKLAGIVEKTAIVDFDIVNPYFRTMDAKKYLEDKGVYVIAPVFANTNVDVPAIPPEVNMLFENKAYTAVFDVGGDDLGAKVISRYKEEIIQCDYAHFFVVNIRRPMTNTIEKIREMICSIEESSGLKITHLVNNTNMLGKTNLNDIMEGNRVVNEIANEMGVKVAFTSGLYNILKEAEEYVDGELFYIEKMIKLPWD
ncbi:MAG TPA: hypothetical protein PK733_16115 [Clostridiales bacterium]|nr:hypothetical protein [Clostridiales bacterium]